MLFRSAEDQEVWMENLRAKSRGLRQIYVENEALLNLYLRPFLEQESRLTKELAAEFLKGLVDLGEQGVCDRLVCIRTGTLLRRFFEKENDLLLKYIRADLSRESKSMPRIANA